MYIGRLLCMLLVEIELSKMHEKEWTLGELARQVANEYYACNTLSQNKKTKTGQALAFVPYSLGQNSWY